MKDQRVLSGAQHSGVSYRTGRDGAELWQLVNYKHSRQFLDLYSKGQWSLELVLDL